MKPATRLLSLIVAACVLFFAAGAAVLHAQGGSAVISGTVLDPVGGAVQNATVVARSESSGAEYRATTDVAGKFSIGNLPAGNYTVEVSAAGFAMASRGSVKSTLDRSQEISIALSLGSVSDAITVEAAASGSIAAQHAPMDGLLEARGALRDHPDPDPEFHLADGRFRLTRRNGSGNLQPEPQRHRTRPG